MSLLDLTLFFSYTRRMQKGVEEDVEQIRTETQERSQPMEEETAEPPDKGVINDSFDQIELEKSLSDIRL